MTTVEENWHTSGDSDIIITEMWLPGLSVPILQVTFAASDGLLWMLYIAEQSALIVRWTGLQCWLSNTRPTIIDVCTTLCTTSFSYTCCCSCVCRFCISIKGGTGGGGWGHPQGAVYMVAIGLAVKGAWLAPGGPILTQATWTGL